MVSLLLDLFEIVSPANVVLAPRRRRDAGR